MIDIPPTKFNKLIFKYPNIKASNDMIPNLQNPKNPLPYDAIKLPPTVDVGD